MAVDTAASTVIFDLRLMDELQLESTGQTGTSFHTKGQLPIYGGHVGKFQIGNLVYHGDFNFVDLSLTNRGLEKAEDSPIDGLIGADLLIKWNATIDYEDLSLVIRNRGGLE